MATGHYGYTLTPVWNKLINAVLLQTSKSLPQNRILRPLNERKEWNVVRKTIRHHLKLMG